MRSGGVACIARVAQLLAAAGCEPIRIAVAQPEDVERYGSVMPDGLDVEWVLDAVTHAGPIDCYRGLDRSNGLIQIQFTTSSSGCTMGDC